MANYRDAYGVHACTGILFNHESHLWPRRFVTRKITSAAVRIARGELVRQELGNMEVWRDWGYVPEYVEAMWRMLQTDFPVDYLVCIGGSQSLAEFVERRFSGLGLGQREHTDSRSGLLLPSGLPFSRGDPSRILQDLGWRAATHFDELIGRLIQAELEESR